MGFLKTIFFYLSLGCFNSCYQVHTFDGLKVNTTVGDCPIILSTPCEHYQSDLFAIAIKRGRAGGLGIHVASAAKDLVINADGRGIEVSY